MSNQKIGVAIFAGLLVLTGIISSGRFFDANALLDRFMDRTSEDDQMASLPDGVEIKSTDGEDSATVPSAEEPKQLTQEAEKNTDAEDAPEVDATSGDRQVEQASAPKSDQRAPDDEKPAETVLGSQETEPAEVAELAIDTSDKEAETRDGEANTPAPVPPVFDLLRVEPNGDMVVAGVSSPGAEMELVAGTKTLTKTTANANGEFVAILDEALNPGDYEIVLRSTDSNGVVMTSAETAIVSIPDVGSDEVIALVEAPGEPSRLITIPQEAPATAAAESNNNEIRDTELASSESGSDQSVTSSDEAAVETAKVEPASEPVEEAAPQTASAEKRIRIEAVEIDGPTVFVAGAAEPGTKLRVYANEILLGDTQASGQGRFLIEVNKDLPVGDYIIRADALSNNGAEVVMRAAVPFTRSAGEKLAAVAVPATTRLPNAAPKIEQEAAVEQTADTAAVSGIDNAGTQATNEAQPQAAATDTEVASAGSEEQNSAQTSGAGILEQPLRQVENSVVIRRGDTLWHISKRVYGQGIKYTTIYKANNEQIRDPDMIWPGQVFALPEEGAASNN